MEETDIGMLAISSYPPAYLGSDGRWRCEDAILQELLMARFGPNAPIPGPSVISKYRRALAYAAVQFKGTPEFREPLPPLPEDVVS